MHLTCPECSTTFAIPAEKLGEGKKVRCSQCKHIWFAEPEDKPATLQIKAPKASDKPQIAKSSIKASEDDDLPKKLLSTKFLKVAVSVLVLLNLGAFVWFNKSIIGQTAFYDLIGQYDTKAWEIDTYSAGVKQQSNKTGSVVEIAWNLKNTSTKPMRVPEVRFKLFDKQAENIGTKITLGSSKPVAGGEQIKFKDKLIHETKTARYLTIEVGNHAELATR